MKRLKPLRMTVTLLFVTWAYIFFRLLFSTSGSSNAESVMALITTPPESSMTPALDKMNISYSSSKTTAMASEDPPNWKELRRINSQGESFGPPRFLLGIMTHDMLWREVERRQMLRDTYIKYYKQHGTPAEEDRLCALHEIINHNVSFENCQVAYAFVRGQIEDPPADSRTELLNVGSTNAMLRQPTRERNKNGESEADILSLDIKENGKFGKSPTWFRYATLLMKERSLSFDYIIKTDSDTLLIPARFLRWIDEKEEQVDYQRDRIYGGVPLDKRACGWPDHDHCENMTAPYFNGGGLYFASIDVSEYIVSDDCPRSELFIPHEDVTMGNYVHSMTKRTGLAIQNFSNIDAYHTTWKHPVKDPKRMRSLWRTYLSKKKQRMRAKKKNATLTKGN